jgi:tetratricopeptide (TPR) repeat protein
VQRCGGGVGRGLRGAHVGEPGPGGRCVDQPGTDRGDQRAVGPVGFAALPGEYADRAHRSLGIAYARLDRYEDARLHLARALDAYARLGDRAGRAHTHLNLAWLAERQALDLYRAAGHDVGHANALNAVGWCHAQLGAYRPALASCQQALTLLDALGDRFGQAATWDSIG